MEKIALITGGTSGIGLECAKKFLVNKINVILVGRNKDKYIEARKYLNGIKDKDIPVIQDKVKINIQSSKKRRSSTKAISFRVPNEIYNEFIKKVDETGLDKDKILLEMIKEWIE